MIFIGGAYLETPVSVCHLSVCLLSELAREDDICATRSAYPARIRAFFILSENCLGSAECLRACLSKYN